MSGTGPDRVLLIGSGACDYRRYLMQGIAEVAPLWLLDGVVPSWQVPYIRGSSVIRPLDEEGLVADRDGLAASALTVSQSHRILGVVTYDELMVTATAHVAERLGLPGLGVAGAENCRDKSRTRALLTAAGVPQPRYALVDDVDRAIEAAGRIGYPVVAKPRGMGMSVGVVQASGPDDLRATFGVVDRARRAGPPAYAAGVLIEEMVAGPELSIDAAVAGGQYRPFCVARKQLGSPPFFEEIGHLVDAADPMLTDGQLTAVLAAAHQALGVVDGITHTEVKLTDRGPVIIEVNARLGGDLIPYLGQLASGVDPGRVAAEIATGRPPTIERTRRACAGIRFLYPPQDCRVLEVDVPARAAVPHLAEARAMAAPGTRLRLPPNAHLGRYAYVLAVASTPAECQAALDEAADLVTLRYEPLDPADRQGDRPW